MGAPGQEAGAFRKGVEGLQGWYVRSFNLVLVLGAYRNLLVIDVLRWRLYINVYLVIRLLPTHSTTIQTPTDIFLFPAELDPRSGHISWRCTTRYWSRTCCASLSCMQWWRSSPFRKSWGAGDRLSRRSTYCIFVKIWCGC